MTVVAGIFEEALHSLGPERQTENERQQEYLLLKASGPAPRIGYGVHFAVSHLSIMDTLTELMYPCTSPLHRQADPRNASDLGPRPCLGLKPSTYYWFVHFWR